MIIQTLLGVGCLVTIAAGGLANAGGDSGVEQPSADVIVPEITTEQRVVDLAICLDTSGSMDGLIESAKQKLWAIVNELALAEPTPRLRVALLTFGNDGHNAEGGWVRVDAPLTEDLDTISQQLFALTTNGGTELVGRVLQSASKLDWHPSTDALKLIVVAGNESADQDEKVPFRSMCKSIITDGIMINSIYCGPEADDIAPAWREVALLADGQFASIDQNQGTVVIATPFDEQLSVLSASLNTTYLPYGEAGQERWANQQLQDDNAKSLNDAACAQRAATKASAVYSCGTWDLVDGCANGQIVLADIKVEDLPENMREMTIEERQAYLDETGAKRAGIQEQIAALAKDRDAYVAEEMKRLALDTSKSFDNAVRQAVRDQAAAKGFSFRSDDTSE